MRIWLGGMLWLWCSVATFGAEDRLNVLLIMADDLRPELASYGLPAITPNLDRLSSESVQFERAYCQQAVCNPSRSSMLTGRRPDTLHVWSNGVHFRDGNPEVTTLPLWFKEHGYTSLCAGKIFHNWHTEVQGDPRSWSEPEFLHYANHNRDHAQVDKPLPEDHASAPRCECRDVPDEAYFDGRVAAEAVRQLNQMGDKPFFLAVGFWKPHSPFNAPKKYWNLYQRDEIPKFDPRRPSGTPEVAFHDSRELRGAPPNQIDFTPQQAAEIRHGYYANTSYMDAQLGKVLEALARNNLREKTIVIFVSDHGYHLGEHSLWAKTSNFELDARVPLMISVPGTPHGGKRTTALAELVDLFPTCVELCGLPQPEGLDGTSLVPVLQDPSASVQQAAYTQHPRPAYYDREPEKVPQVMGYSVRTPAARYTEWRDWKTGRLVGAELYDHRHDPREMQNRTPADQRPSDDVGKQAVQALHRQFPPDIPPAHR